MERPPRTGPARASGRRPAAASSPPSTACLIIACAATGPGATSAASASARSCSASVGHDLVGEADAQRLVGLHLPAGDHHLLGPAGTDQARQALRAAAAGDDAEQDLGLAEHGPLAGDAVVARQRQLAPAAEGVAGDGGDDEPRDRGDGVERVVEAGGDRGAPRSASPNSVMSAPAAKIRSPPVTTTAPGGSAARSARDLAQLGEQRPATARSPSGCSA